MPTPPNPANVCAFCIRGMSHEGACLSEADAYTSLGLLFTPTGLLLQPPEPLGPDHRPLRLDPENPQRVILRRKRRPLIVTSLLFVLASLIGWR